ncbi:hypothetical protein S245_024829, partial [Arachis hypogaea]
VPRRKPEEEDQQTPPAPFVPQEHYFLPQEYWQQLTSSLEQMRITQDSHNVFNSKIDEGRKGVKCGIYGANCPGWIISMEACNAQGFYCVPLYDTLGAGAVEFIICHAEILIAFVEKKKIPKVLLLKLFVTSVSSYKA